MSEKQQLKFTTSGKVLRDHVAAMKTLCGPDTVNLNIIDREGVFLETTNKDWHLRFRLGELGDSAGNETTSEMRKKAEKKKKKKHDKPEKSAGPKRIVMGLPAEVLQGTAAGRTEVTFIPEMRSNLLSVSSKGANNRRFNAALQLVEPARVGIDMMLKQKHTSELHLSDDIQTLLTDSLNKVALTDVFTKDELNLWLHSTEEGTAIACFDASHGVVMWFDNVKAETGELEMCVPLTVFQAINKLARKSSYSLRFTPTGVIGMGDDFTVAIPSVQTAASRFGLQAILNRAKQLRTGTRPEVRLMCESTFLTEPLTSMKALIGKNDGVMVQMEADSQASSFSLSVNSQAGAMREKLENIDGFETSLKGNVGKRTFKVAPLLWADCLNCAGKGAVIELNVSGEDGLNCVWMCADDPDGKYTATYILGLAE